MTDVKICGIRDEETLQAAAKAGATYVGFVFYPPSPRFITPQAAAKLAGAAPPTIKTVGLFVDPDDETLADVLGTAGLDMIQLHGDESPERVTEIKARFGLPVMKAIALAAPEDLDNVEAYEAVCDWLLFDTKTTEAPGGTGQSFDWTILSGRSFKRPWMLAGGLNETNLQQALAQLEPDGIDVSSGVESAPGIKNIEKIKNFINIVKSND